MILIEEDTVVVHTSGVTATTWMLPVLPDTTMTGADVASLLPVLPQSGCHFSPLSLLAASYLPARAAETSN